MNRPRAWIAPVGVVGLLLAGFGWLFSLRLGSGDVYPHYSSLRADALGTRALHDALARVPGLTVERDYRVLARLQPRDRTVFFLGTREKEWEKMTVAEFRALHAALRNGARLVIAFPAAVTRDQPASQPASHTEKPASPEKFSSGKDTPPPEPEAQAEKTKVPAPEKKKTVSREEADLQERALEKEWGVTFKQRWLFTPEPVAARTAQAPAELPESVKWHSDVYFGLEKETPWRVLYRRAEEPVLIEKIVGQGSIVLVADSFFLSNEAMQRARVTGLIAWLVGSHREIAFHEGVLGVIEDNGLGALGRRYGLGGAFALTVLLGALYAWGRVVAFQPLPDETHATGEVALAHDPAAGLTSLLRRSLRGPTMLATCVTEWRKSLRNPTPAETRLISAWQANPSTERPAETYNALAQTLKVR